MTINADPISFLNVTVPCNACDADDACVLYPAGVAQVNQIVQCQRCGLMYANPRRDADHVGMELCPDDPNWDIFVSGPQRFEKERLQVRDYEGTRALLNRLHPDRGRLLELGSSMGFLLDSFRRDGWDVLGVDPDKNGCRYATQRLGIPTIPATLESADLPENSAQVVVMLHVIEHVPDPVGTLRAIHRVLMPGGHLVLETPRYDTLTYKLLGRRERSLSCDGHIFFFTTESLSRVYTRAGFELEKIDYVGRSLTLDRLAYNLGVMSKSPVIQRGLIQAARRLFLNQLRLRLNMRDMQRVCLRK